MVARLFDPHLRRLRQRRAPAGESFLARRAGADLVDRLAGINRRFERAAILGHGWAIEAALAEAPEAADRIGVRYAVEVAPGVGSVALVAEPEALPFAPASLDLVISVLALHAVNDLPGALIQIRQTLKPDGLFLGAMFGGATLQELRAALLEAELELTGGGAARVFPFTDVRAAGGLLQRAGFALPVVDLDTVRVRYASAFGLFQDLRQMGETNCLAGLAQTPPLTRAVLMEASARYAARWGDADGRIPATFDILTLTGWAPHASQPKPLQPGSAQVSLADVLSRR